MTDICRTDPPYNSSYLLELPIQPKFTFEITDLEILQKWDYYNTRYTLLINGYNFNLPTKNNYRRLQIGKQTYNNLMAEFERFDYLYKMVNTHKWTIATIIDYIENTTTPLSVKYQTELSQIKKQNKLSQILWDSIRHKLQHKINKLTDWNDYIEYDGVKYGLNHIVDRVHRENNCMGKITDTPIPTDPCRCSSCENWFGCGRDIGAKYIKKCDNCEYTHTYTHHNKCKPWK